MSDQFTFTQSHKTRIMVFAALGAVLMLLGYFLSNIKSEGHGGGHGEDHNAQHAAAPGDAHGKQDPHAQPAAHAANTPAPAHADPHAAPGEEAEMHAAPKDSDTTAIAMAPAVPVDMHGTLPELNGGDSSELWHLAYPARAYVWPGNTHAAGHHEETGDMHKWGGALLMASWFFLGISVFGIFFIAFSYTANAGWFVAFKRVPEVFYNWLPIASVMVVIVFFAFGKQIWAHWVGTEPGHDAIIDGKRGFLNMGFFIANAVGVLGLWYFFGHKLRASSIAEDSVGGTAEYERRRKLSILFLPLFALPFCMLAFQWLMSIETHWFSTMYGVYCFVGIVLSGFAITMLVTVNLKEKGYLENVSMEHLHDLGKFIFAFSVFWGYIFVSQFLLIWYANMPEETTYYRLRYDNHKFLFFLNIVVNFAGPFLILMTRNAKRSLSVMKTIGAWVLVGRFVDLYLLIAPGVMLGNSGVGYFLMCGGAILMVSGPFMYLVYHNLTKAPLTAKNHPYLQESVHHSTGV